MSATPERFIWAVELLNLQPQHSVLEIGCGAGLLAQLIAGKLKSGNLVAIDKSNAMLQKARKRNDKQKIEFLNLEFALFDSKQRFDKIVAFNVNFFWKAPDKEFIVLQKIVQPGGKIYAFFDAPYNRKIEDLIGLITRNLESFGFKVLSTETKKLRPGTCFCIIFKPDFK